MDRQNSTSLKRYLLATRTFLPHSQESRMVRCAIYVELEGLAELQMLEVEALTLQPITTKIPTGVALA